MKVKVKAPGRVNLIGEHTDYNMGFVLPMAINRGITLKASSREDLKVNVYASDLEEKASFSLRNLSPGEKRNWWDYLAGTCWSLIEAGYKLKGADIEFGGDLPVGAGLSSSAALEIATAAAFVSLNNINIDRKQIALICQKAENDYVGVRCGVMDQFASALCLKDNALLIDCLSNECTQVPLKTNDYSVVIVDSRVKRTLSGSEYNKRREECEEALDRINKITGSAKKSLREVTIEEINRAKDSLGDILLKRSMFIFKENKSVLEAVDALNKSNLAYFGTLMNESHEGLKELFEVSCAELDIIVDKALEVDGVLGARMTGAGFGGCVVSLVNNNSIADLKRNILKSTKDVFLKEPGFYITAPENGFIVEETA